MEKTSQMINELTIKRKMTKSIKDKLDNRIFLNCFLASWIIIYICIMDLIYIYASSEVSTIMFKVFPIISIIITIITFEYAYRKENLKIAIVGIELLVFSIIFLYMPKIYEHLDKKICLKLAFIPIFCAIYYIAKSIIIYINTEKKYQNSLSDVKEIVKDDK